MDDTTPQPADMARSSATTDERPIVLVGMMGAGKSSIGKRLAARLNLPFYDADEEIEKAAGKTISEIFADHGEPYFRDGERRVIARLLSDRRCVLATGGGAFAQDETRAMILNAGIVVWLDVPIDMLVERVARRSHRPLLAGKDPATVLTELMEKRAPAYAQAHIRVVADGGPHTAMVDKVTNALAGYMA